MFSTPISRRLALKIMFGAAAGLTISDAYSGDFRYEYKEETGSDRNWPDNLVRAIQNRLNELGYDSGEADGLYGPKTRRAIMDFQYSENLKVDGKISDGLIGELELE